MKIFLPSSCLHFLLFFLHEKSPLVSGIGEDRSWDVSLDCAGVQKLFLFVFLIIFSLVQPSFYLRECAGTTEACEMIHLQRIHGSPGTIGVKPQGCPLLGFWMRWNVESMTRLFRPIRGWIPEKMVPLMHSADVPDVLGEFRSRQAGYAHAESFFDL